MAAHFPPYTKPTQEPTGAYRAPPEISEVEAQLKTAHAHMRYAAECIDKALAAHITAQPAHPIDASTQHGQSRKLYDAQTRRDVAWSVQRVDFSLPKWHVDFGKPKRDALPPNLAAAVKTPLEPARIATPAELADLRQLLTAEELKGFGIGDVEPRHVLHAEALRQADEFNLGSGETGV